MTPKFKVGDVLLVDVYAELHLQEVVCVNHRYKTKIIYISDNILLGRDDFWPISMLEKVARAPSKEELEEFKAGLL